MFDPIDFDTFRYYEKLDKQEREDAAIEEYCERNGIPEPETCGERRELLNEIDGF